MNTEYLNSIHCWIRVINSEFGSKKSPQRHVLQQKRKISVMILLLESAVLAMKSGLK